MINVSGMHYTYLRYDLYKRRVKKKPKLKNVSKIIEVNIHNTGQILHISLALLNNVTHNAPAH